MYGGSFDCGPVYDKPLIESTYNIIKSIPNCIFFDIGSSTSSFTLLSKYTDCIMYSFEPHPLILDILK